MSFMHWFGIGACCCLLSCQAACSTGDERPSLPLNGLVTDAGVTGVVSHTLSVQSGSEPLDAEIAILMGLLEAQRE